MLSIWNLLPDLQGQHPRAPAWKETCSGAHFLSDIVGIVAEPLKCLSKSDKHDGRTRRGMIGERKAPLMTISGAAAPATKTHSFLRAAATSASASLSRAARG